MTSPTLTTNPRTLTFDSQLIEDFLHTEEILIDESFPSPLAVFQNKQGQSEVIVINKNSRGTDELYHVYREPLSDSGWNVYGIGAYAAGMAAATPDTLWAVGTDQQIWCCQAGRWSQNVAQLPGGATPLPINQSSIQVYAPISAGTDGTVWAVDSNGKLYELDSQSNSGQGTWQPVASSYPLSTAPVGSSANFFAISGNQFVQYSSGQWQVLAC